MKFAILKNEFDDNHEYWKRSCEKYGQQYQIIDMLSSDWLSLAISKDFDGFLACPSGRETMYKEMYDEKIYILDRVLGKLVYPSYDEISIHENKKYLSYWLTANQLPHSETRILYDIEETRSFIETCDLPIVGKINIGASGKGVKVFRDREQLKKYAELAFKDGLRQEWGPNLKMGGYKSRVLNLIKNPGLIKRKLLIYKKVYNEIQKGYVILQKYIPHDYEWRVVRIGDSYFGHQKVKQGDKASGTKGINYIAPPSELLNFLKDTCDKFGFRCMAIDLFEDGNDGYLINEMQCIFGHIQEYICEEDGKPGRFVQRNGEWVFEPGLFNSNLSYDLRMEDVLKKITLIL